MGAGAGEIDDAALVALARREPGEGWTAIWDRHGAGLYGVCLRLLGDRADADDVVAEVFLTASQRLDQLRDPEALRAWLHAIARRSVQRRWRARDRTVPVDPQGLAMTGRSTLSPGPDDLGPLGAREAAELVAAVSSGLSIRDRELLALTLDADLDTTEVARITGEAPNAISVRVSRLKDTLGRAAGALLVARHHRRDCAVLDGILADWDGGFDTVWRKRIARHVDDCDDCDERRRGAVAAFASPMLLAPPGDALRDRVLEPIRSTGPQPTHAEPAPPSDATGDLPVPGVAGLAEIHPLDDSGFPVPQPWSLRRRRRGLLAVVAAAVVTLVIVAGVVAAGDEPGPDLALVDGTPTTTVATTTTTDPPPDTSTTTTPPPDSSAPTDDPDLATPPVPPSGSTGEGPAVVSPPVVDTTVPRVVPSVRLTVDPDEVMTGCGGEAFADATVVVGAGSGSESTTISWDGPDSGSLAVDGTGSHLVVIGPFVQVDEADASQTILVTATTTDAAGGTATDTEPLQVTLVPC